jgi:EAL domain-containing protein (putative c-di-GMP-specific phosphodiesterase class I)/DNA-binding response OmpR family regulator
VTPAETALRSVVLIIDDDPDTRALIVLALKRAGLGVIDAPSGEDGLAAVREHPVEVIVCDLGMPGMSGLDVVRSLRSDPRTATLPFLLMTGSGDADTVIDALEAGADDFLGKPVRLDELVARVRAHLRTQSAWSQVVEQELRGRAAAVAALGRLTISTDPEQAAELLVGELSHRTGSQYVGVLRVMAGGGLQPLATFDVANGVRRGGARLPAALARELLNRTQAGPWSRRVRPARPEESGLAFWDARIDLAAGAPIYSGERLVAILNLGIALDPEAPLERAHEARLLASVIDFAGVLGAVAGPAMADRDHAAGVHARLREALVDRAFHTVFQPVVALETRNIMGYEALTRFDDGTRPDVRFAEANASDLGSEYELAAVESALVSSRGLPDGAFLALNVSPAVVLDAGRRLGCLLRGVDRRLVLELTEHVAIDDYAALRRAIDSLGGVEIAVDDAGAGYASLRHLLELRPAFAKLDITLVRNIHADPLRQALAAGLGYYAQRTGCQLIAEGVEAEEDAIALMGLGVDLAQGYLFGRPARLGDGGSAAPA